MDLYLTPAAVRAVLTDIEQDAQSDPNDGPAERARRVAHDADVRRIRAALADPAGTYFRLLTETEHSG